MVIVENQKEIMTSKMASGNKVADLRSLFSTSTDQSLRFFPPQRSKGKMSVVPPKEVFKEGEVEWRNAVVAQLIGRPPNFNMFQRLVNVLWGVEGEVVIHPAGSKLYIIQLPNASMQDKVLDEGPWHIQNKPLVVRKWEPGLPTLEFIMAKLLVWIHLVNVLLELFTQIGLSYIASAIGSPIYIDRITASKERLAFAKICIKVEASKEIPRLLRWRCEMDLQFLLR